MRIALIPGRGPAAARPCEALQATVRYLRDTRERMAEAVEDFVPFPKAYEATDWSELSHLPAFDATHRRNAYGLYLSLERESLGIE